MTQTPPMTTDWQLLTDFSGYEINSNGDVRSKRSKEMMHRCHYLDGTAFYTLIQDTDGPRRFVNAEVESLLHNRVINS
jgi:hypothetical protein